MSTVSAASPSSSSPTGLQVAASVPDALALPLTEPDAEPDALPDALPLAEPLPEPDAEPLPPPEPPSPSFRSRTEPPSSSPQAARPRATTAARAASLR